MAIRKAYAHLFEDNNAVDVKQMDSVYLVDFPKEAEQQEPGEV